MNRRSLHVWRLKGNGRSGWIGISTYRNLIPTLPPMCTAGRTDYPCEEPPCRCNAVQGRAENGPVLGVACPRALSYSWNFKWMMALLSWKQPSPICVWNFAIPRE